MVNAAVDVLTDPAFISGVIGGCVVLATGAVSWVTSDRRSVLAFGGLLVVLAASLILLGFELIDWFQILGFALLAAAGQLERSPLLGPLLALPGAFLVVRPTAADEVAWLSWIGLLAIVAAAPIVAAFDRRYAETGLGLPLFGIAALGVFLAVPDTEGALVLLGVAGVSGFLGWPHPTATLGRAGSYAAVGVYLLVATDGSMGRPAAIFATIALLGLLLVVPLAMSLRGTGWAWHLDHIDPFVLLFAQLVLALLIARTAGLLESTWAAAVLSAGLLAATAAALLATPLPSPSQLRDWE